jgi:glycosyltransferase involved in cell wall biosynthesis
VAISSSELWQSDNSVQSISAGEELRAQPSDMDVALLTGDYDRPYVFGLAMALAPKGVCLDVIGGDTVDRPELHATPNLSFLNLRGDKSSNIGLRKKISRVLLYYARLIRYASTAKPKIFHILWNNKFQLFDRTLLMMYYKLRGKKIAFTAHNVNAGKRDGNDSFLNRLSLRTQYRLADHIFVHTEKMRKELAEEFGIGGQRVTVIPFGINDSVPNTALTPAQARLRLGIPENDRLLLFFGNIGPYKGVEFLVAAFQRLVATNLRYRLIIAGSPRVGSEKYLGPIRESIRSDSSRDRVMERIEYIPDEETEIYFKAADVFVLPYTHIFQSGVLLLGYSFGLPVIATRVGSLEQDVIEGQTGFVCNPRDPDDLARTIDRYFQSDLFKNLNARRSKIRQYANAKHSWDTVAQMTREVYARLLERTNHEPAGIDSHSCLQRAAMDR